MTTLYLGFLQIDVRLGAIDHNLASVAAGLSILAPSAPGLVLLPELWAFGFAYDRLAELTARMPEVHEALQGLAARHRVLLAGSLPEPGPDGKMYNSLFVTGPHGPFGVYRKQHLFAPMAEDRHFSPGDRPLPMDTPLGPVGGLVCYDLRFPELARVQVSAGASLLLVAGQWPKARVSHWRGLLIARAIENQVFVLACNRCGRTGSEVFAGHSMLVGPDGAIMEEAGEEEARAGLLVDLDLVRVVRSRFNTAGPRPYPFLDHEKILALPELLKVVSRAREIGKRVVFTNGCFDILHAGHVEYLVAARRQGDCLIVGLNSDASVRSIKGPERPVNRQENRARVLAGLGSVDYVALFDKDTPRELIVQIMPDVLVKGADWAADAIVGGPEVLARGGKVVRIPMVAGLSTTGVIEQVKKIPGQGGC